MSERPKAYLTQKIPVDGTGLTQLQAVCDVNMYDEVEGGQISVSRERLLKDVVGANALILPYPVKVDAELLDAAGSQLKVIATVSVGLDHIDLKECARRRIPVGYTPDVLTDAVAEGTIGLTLATARRHKEGVQAVSGGSWGSTWDSCLYLCGQELRGATVGIVGLGRIGLGVARRLRAFSIGRLMYCGRSPKDYAGEVEAEYVSFDQLLENSDFVIACCSVNPSNHNLFDAAAFKKMKKSAILINTSRGILVDQDALYDALSSGEILRAGLDVTSPEPFPPDHRLLTLPNCLVLPHLGSASMRARHAMVDLAVRNTLAGLRGEPLETPVPI
ncbi:glyoxylate reductase/hydroxypyruvate reductase-like [Mya arenaria]|nr:glyoxylate reductase/hydroxypyruvate reductase-like [Mya arenaria]XP_052791395.1 glyoxylate reductase/hydroxypyruvate reductase-like [Mya arenaria]